MELAAEQSLVWLNQFVNALSPYSSPVNVSVNLQPFLDVFVNKSSDLNNLGVVMANKNTTINSIQNITNLT